LEQVTAVGLSGNPDLTSIAGMGQVHNLEGLYIADCPVSDLTGAEGLGVRGLTILNSSLTNLSGLGDASALERLSLLVNTDLTSLEGLSAPPIMEEVLLQRNTALTSLRGLEGLREVERFSVINDPEASRLGALTGLEGLEQVGTFVLEATASLTDLTGLSALRRVADFQITFPASLRDLSGLAQLEEVGLFYLVSAPQLVSLTGLGSATIHDLQVLEVALPDLQGLEEVTIGDSFHLSSSAPLSSLDGAPRFLEASSLSLSDCPALSNLAALQTLTALRRLELSNTGVSHLDDLGNLRQLGRLIIVKNRNLAQLNGLSNVAGLESMTIRENAQLLSLPVFPNLSDCVDCDGFALELLDNEALESGPGLPGIATASGILVTNNPVLSRLDGLSQVRSLSRLEVVNNTQLTDVDLSSLNQAGAIVIRGNDNLDDVPLIALASALDPPPTMRIVSNQSGPALLDPCPWTGDAICDETEGDCSPGSDLDDCQNVPTPELTETSEEAQP
jgi:hypothetical protein